MKLLHFADLHIGMENHSRLDPQTGLSSRLLEFFNVFDFIVDTALKENVDLVVFAGDAYKTRDPNPTQQRGFGERIKRLVKKNIPVALVVGNHDTSSSLGKANTLDIYSALEIDKVYVSRHLEYLKINTKSGNLQIITLPWLPKEDYKKIAENLNLLYEKIETSSPAILVSHAEVEGASFGSEKGLALTGDVTIPLALLQDKRLYYVALGHIHKHQVLAKNPLIVYSGSPVRIDFGEEAEEKGICLVEITQSKNNPNSSFKFLPTPARKFCTITISLKDTDQDPTSSILSEIKKHKIEEKIVRLIINIPTNLNKDIEMDKIKKALSKSFLIAGISRNIERLQRFRIEGVEETERLTPIEALRKYFESKKISNERAKELEKYAEQLFNE